MCKNSEALVNPFTKAKQDETRGISSGKKKLNRLKPEVYQMEKYMEACRKRLRLLTFF
jgi:hypothetical protein